MKRFLFCIALLASLSRSAYSQSNIVTPHAKISPLTEQYLFESKKLSSSQKIVPNYVYKIGADQKRYISSMIKVNSNIRQQKLDELGIRIGTKAGNIWTAQIPLENVEAFTKLPGIDYLQLDQPVAPTMDSVRKVTRVDSVHAGYNLPMPYNGENIVVGIIDGGFDYTHPELFDTTGVGFRVKKIWVQKTTSGTPPAGFSYGTEITDSTAMWALGTDGNGSHGAHVTGICAGSGFGSTNKKLFRGIAYKSELVLVGISPDEAEWINTGVSDMIDGLNYIFQYAASVGKPAVVNLSWGSPVGPHDGTSLFSTALDNLTGAGKIFICSAGNKGTDSIHLQKIFTVTDTLVQTFLPITNTPVGKRTWVTAWGEEGKSFCANVTLFSQGTSGDSTGFICLDNTTHHTYLIGSKGDTCFIDITTYTSDFNQKPHIFFNFNSRTTDSIYISLKGNVGTVNMWTGFVHLNTGYESPFDNFGQPWAVKGDTKMTLSDIATTNTAVTVGAFASKVLWKNISGASYSIGNYVKRGDLVPFSSKGPTADGRIKPDITAPGIMVGAGVSSYDAGFTSNSNIVISRYHNPNNNRDYPYVLFSGTSMSSPAVAGIVALLLQINPNLTPEEVKTILSETAIQDIHTGTIPAGGISTWGNGKVNAYSAVKRMLQQAGIGAIHNGELECDVFPNPNNGTFTINYIGNSKEKVTVNVYDLMAHLISSKDWETNAGYNTTQFDLSTLSKGIYFIKISSQSRYAALKMIVE